MRWGDAHTGIDDELPITFYKKIMLRRVLDKEGLIRIVGLCFEMCFMLL